jgi:hypothetical protein
MLYDRLRIIIKDHQRPFNRFDETARARLSALIEDVGGYYAGWQGHSTEFPNPTHLAMVDNPTEKMIAKLLLFARTSEKKHGVSLKIFREVKGKPGSQEYSVEGIVRNIAALLGPMMLTNADSVDVARSWSDIRIMEEMLVRVLAAE